MSQVTSPPLGPHDHKNLVQRAVIFVLGLIVTALIGALIQGSFDHKKMIETEAESQKISEIGEFLKSTEDFYPVMGDFVDSLLRKPPPNPWSEKKLLLQNLNKQFSTLQMSASYLSPADQSEAKLYEQEMADLMVTVRSTQDAASYGALARLLNEAIPRRCILVQALRKAADLPSATIDPACAGTMPMPASRAHSK